MVRLADVVFFGREQRFQFLAECLASPPCIDRHGIGEDREGDGAKAGEPGEDFSSVGVAGRFSCSIRWRVLIAAMMSRAFDFSPLAMLAGVIDDGGTSVGLLGADELVSSVTGGSGWPISSGSGGSNSE